MTLVITLGTCMKGTISVFADQETDAWGQKKKMVAPGEVPRSALQQSQGSFCQPGHVLRHLQSCPPEKGSLVLLLKSMTLTSLRTRGLQISLFPGYVSPAQEVWGQASIKNAQAPE